MISQSRLRHERGWVRADLSIGLPLYDQTLTDEGQLACIWDENPTITFSAAATIRGAETGAELGLAVAGAGDVNGDGYSDILVGAPLFDSGAADAGRTVFTATKAGTSTG
ncbi:MAG: integrin alpha [Flavobacteriales bacterium]